MAIGWLTALKLVPWSDVISNAPVVAAGAKKLWDALAKKPLAPDAAAAVGQPAELTPAQSIPLLQSRVMALESVVADLHAQMIDSTALIQALAEQNSQLIIRVETHRVRVRWLALLALVGLVTALIALFFSASAP